MESETLSTWFSMMAEAMRGATDSQEAMLAYTQVTTPQEMARWIARYMPGAQGLAAPGAVKDWPEAWWRMTGLVPRVRYLEQLERTETLRRRLEEAEATIAHLRSQLHAENPAAPAQVATEAWQAMWADLLKAQDEWLQAWKASSPLQEDS